MKYYVKTVTTPLGELGIVADEKSILALVWSMEDLKNLGILAWELSPKNILLETAAIQLKEYFRGDRKKFNLPLDLRGTDFQKKVWKELAKIPFGKTWSYQELARRIGSPLAVRAVGTANAKNPVCIFIPCHRVIRLSGELGGYAGGTEQKAFLLNLESAK
jgi:methylated-DNA-[protein]-cysteine S-methyltransferase